MRRGRNELTALRWVSLGFIRFGQMAKIKVLSDLLVNKIAAGEVIERPASVVKELVENALDAGAAHITVNIEDGGKQLIRVSDDGVGMDPENLRLAVMPHATSKISHEDDLFNIGTLGFRGEALPSIGSVSQMRIVTRTKDSIEGSEIVVAAEQVKSSSAAGCRAGTTVEVRDLFFNVPARRKFLKSNATEVGHINEQLSRLALAHRQIGFELTNNGRNSLKLNGGGGVRERIAALFGTELAGELMAIERCERGLHIEGYVAPPSRSRSTASWQYVLVNGRFIRDRFIQHAVREAYRGLMESSRHPIVFLFLTIDPGAVDVNVHPTKIEVRWQDSNLIHSQILAALRDKFLTTDLTPALRAGGALGDRQQPSMETADADEVRRGVADYFKNLSPAQNHASGGIASSDQRTFLSPRDRLPQEISPETWTALYGREDRSAPPPELSEHGLHRNYSDALQSAQRAKAIQVHNAYLVAESEDGLIIIDQHALHERVMYEKLKQQLIAGPLESQRLLLPETLTVTAGQMALIMENQKLLAKLGIEAEPFGNDTIAIQAFPSLLKDADAVATLRDLLDKLVEKGEHTSTEEVVHHLLDTMACKAAIKAGDPLTPEEIDALLAQRGMVEKSSNCPHGRPTALRFSVNDLNKQFKRT